MSKVEMKIMQSPQTKIFTKFIQQQIFLKTFEVIKEDFENKVKPSKITLRCKAIKKFFTL